MTTLDETNTPAIEPIGGPAAWHGQTMDWKSDGLHVLNDQDIQEIDLALRHLKSLGKVDLPDITRVSFPLRAAAQTLDGIRAKLEQGRGFALLRGLPRAQYSTDDMARIFFGIGAYLGRPMPQSYHGEMLGHVMDVSDVEDVPRAYHAGGHMGMHTDSCDVIGLMCLRSAVSGGASRIVSAVALHDELLTKHPDVLRTLYRGFFYRRKDLDGKFGSGRLLSEARVPVFTCSSDAATPLACYFLPGYAKSAAARGDAELTPQERDAIACIERIAESPEFYLDMNFAEGDIQFLNNRLVLHGRTDYEDSKEIQQRRHLLRLWLHVPHWPVLPKNQIFHTAEDHALWLQRRSALMELPSTYLATMQNLVRAR
ncbi:TauD/TfdA family dioxygenase [Cupriavidus necator]|uniref:TauD/TfdA family dioxygenase n=1 Tax=Cupriavidus necator TaxID=106590 RepID=UPI0005B414CD|nr:TauD/TfdA family dioxygenase [Cupriavidus necator]